MKLVIELPDTELTEDIIKRGNWEEGSLFDMALRTALKKATILPKGHGRLIDADALLKKHPEFDTYPFPSTTIDNAPPIIEADMTESEE